LDDGKENVHWKGGAKNVVTSIRQLEGVGRRKIVDEEEWESSKGQCGNRKCLKAT